MSVSMNSLPWVEKYRPVNLDDIISHKDILTTLTNLITNNKIPHMIFYGPPGTGKTTTILACAKKIYGPNYRSMILELNGSDDRGINVVREQIKNFSATDSKISNMLVSDNNFKQKTNIKLVILDEADAMTYDAQFALRRVVESYTNSTRYCLICNYLTKIIPALQSRCKMFRFAPISNTEHLNKINNVIDIEKINITNDATKKIIELSEGDMRRSLNLLQSLYMINSDKLIELNTVYRSIGYPSDDEKNDIIESLKGKTLNETYNILSSFNNLSNQDIIREISGYYSKQFLQSFRDKKKRIPINEQNKLLDLFDSLAKIEVNITSNTNNNIHLLAISSVILNNN